MLAQLCRLRRRLLLRLVCRLVQAALQHVGRRPRVSQLELEILARRLAHLVGVRVAVVSVAVVSVVVSRGLPR